jgi:hypothetical protein
MFSQNRVIFGDCRVLYPRVENLRQWNFDSILTKRESLKIAKYKTRIVNLLRHSVSPLDETMSLCSIARRCAGAASRVTPHQPSLTALKVELT